LFSDVCTKVWRRLSQGIKWHVFGYRLKNTFSTGGLMVAIIGGDGSGKTTVVNNLYKWLSNDFGVKNFHMGKPHWSWTTKIVRGIIKIGCLIGLYPFMRRPINYTLDEELLEFPGYPWMLREICVARDRYLTYLKARRFASNGFIVFCDRFPLRNVKLMDGPQIERMTYNKKRNIFVKLSIELEKMYYEPIKLPDLFIVLRVDPENAVYRKTNEDPISVRARSTEIYNLDWSKTHAMVINANQSKEQVLHKIKNLLWSNL
jgi:thymidylate kinase